MFYFGKTMLFRGIVNFRAKLSAEGRLSRPIHTSAALPAAFGNSGTGGTLSLTLSYLSLLCAEPALVLGIVTVLSCLSGLPFFSFENCAASRPVDTISHVHRPRFSVSVCAGGLSCAWQQNIIYSVDNKMYF